MYDSNMHGERIKNKDNSLLVLQQPVPALILAFTKISNTFIIHLPLSYEDGLRNQNSWVKPTPVIKFSVTGVMINILCGLLLCKRSIGFSLDRY
jgi:energy-converting hydrogenase Eha subunit A